MPRIDTKTGRAALPVRREPHWYKHAKDRHVGFRKTAAAPDVRGSWIGRYRREDGKRTYMALGELSDLLGFDQAVAKALVWFKELDRGVRQDADTVADVCKLYVEDRRRQKGENAANAANRTFQRTIYGGGGKDGKRYTAHDLAAVPLSKVRARLVEVWRDGLVASGLTKSSANRTLTTLRAALNYSVRHRYAGADVAIEWRSVQAFKGADRRRELYLDLDQRRALLRAATGSLRDLLEAAIQTGARAGELVSARVKHFDKRSDSLTLTGKTGTRTVPLSPSAAALFKRLAEDKLPEAFLLTRGDGEPWAHSDWDELVRDAAAKAEVPAGTCLYTLRHSWITAALTNGISPLEVSKLVGTSLRMIDKNYGHLAQNVARERLAKVAML
jgi:integrase